MGKAFTAYKNKKLPNKISTTLITSGFTNTLKNWWDNYLREDNRQNVLNATTINPIIKDESSGQTIENQILEDVTITLTYNIAKHFIGEQQLFEYRSPEILSNLSSQSWTTLDSIKLFFSTKLWLEKIVIMIIGRKYLLVACQNY